MNKLKLLIVLNVVLFFSLLLQILTGIILFFNMLLSVDEFISRVHGYNGFILVGLIVIHIALNWGWVKKQILSRGHGT